MIGLIVGTGDVTNTANVDVGRGQQTDDVSRDRRSSAMIKNTKSSNWFIGSVCRRYKYLYQHEWLVNTCMMSTEAIPAAFLRIEMAEVRAGKITVDVVIRGRFMEQ